jgi:predicted GNAT family N-acyltransferase
MTLQTLTVCTGSWHELGALAGPVRVTVFVDEQHVPLDMEWDADDATSVHAVALDGDGNAVGTGRLLADGHIGRMAVLAPFRGRGIGGRILEELLAVARQRGVGEVVLHAQTHAVRFYERFGFAAFGPVFEEAGIDHVSMRLTLTPESAQS